MHDRVFKWLLFLFKYFYSPEVVPIAWNNAVICPIFNCNRHSSACANYRVITLFSVVCKLYR